MLQELTVDPSDRVECEAQLKKLGWQASINPSEVTEAGGLSGGVTVACRDFVGLGLPPTDVKRLPSPHRQQL
eukprot:553834-Pyramimonas_sp.AAC.1